MKKLLFCLALLALLLLPANALAEGESEDPDESIRLGVEEWIDKLSLRQWQETIRSLPDSVHMLWQDIDIQGMISDYAMTGGGGATVSTDALKRMFLGEFRSTLTGLAAFIGLSVLSGLIKALTDGGSGAGAAGFFMRCIVFSLLLVRLMSIAALSVECINAMSDFLSLALPTLLTLLTALGGIASAGILQPMMTMATGTVSYLMRAIVLPVSIAGGILGMMDQLTGHARIGELAALAQKTAKWMIGIVSVLYLGAVSIRGMAAAAYDGITVRTAKYAASSLLPLVGGMVSGTMDTMLGCAALVKNAAGLAAMLLLFSIAALPLIRILAWMLMLRAAAALSQPIADEKLSKTFVKAADMLSYLFAATASVAMMFLLTTALAAGIGNLSFIG